MKAPQIKALQRKDLIAFVAARNGVELRSLIRIPLGFVIMAGVIVLGSIITVRFSLPIELAVGGTFVTGFLLAWWALNKLVPLREILSPAVLWVGDGMLLFRPQDSAQELVLSEQPTRKISQSLHTYLLRLPNGSEIRVPKQYDVVDAQATNRVMSTEAKLNGDINIFCLKVRHRKIVFGCRSFSLIGSDRHERFDTLVWPDSKQHATANDISELDQTP